MKRNEIIQELEEKIKAVEQDPVKFIATINLLDEYVTKVKMSSKYSKAYKSTYECLNCKKRFLRKNEELSSELQERAVITHCSPWGDDVEYENHKIKELYYTCPYCKQKNFYGSEDLGLVK